MRDYFFVGGRCEAGNCECQKEGGLRGGDAEMYPTPPLHEGCDCVMLDNDEVVRARMDDTLGAGNEYNNWTLLRDAVRTQIAKEREDEARAERREIESRVGKFRVSFEVMDRKSFNALRKVMGRCFILRAERLYAERCFEYVAYSPDFELVEEACSPPEYQWVFNSEDGTVKAVRTEVLFASRP